MVPRHPAASTVGKAVALVIAAAVLFGTTGTAQALGAEGVDPVALGAARIVLGGALLALFIGSGQDAAPVRVPRRRSLPLVMFGAIGVAAYQPTFFTGTAENGVAVGTIVALGSAPVLTGALEWLVLRRTPGIRWAVSTALATVGVVLISGILGASDAPTVTPLGIAGSLGAGLSYAVYAVCGKLLLEQGWSPSKTMGSQFGMAALIMVPVLLLSGPAQLLSLPVLATVAWLGVMTVAVAYTLFARGLSVLPAARVSTITLIEPATATILGVLILRESLGVTAVLGVAVLIVAVVALVLPVRRR